MKRIAYLFIIIISIFLFAVLCRELIANNSKAHNDVTNGDGVIKSPSAAAIQTVDSADCDLQGGLVINSEERFQHRFFYVGAYNRHVAIFNKYGSICWETEIPTDYLNQDTRRLVDKGIYFEDISGAENYIESIRDK